MKQAPARTACTARCAFSALGRAVWDETPGAPVRDDNHAGAFSALGRAVWDETLVVGTDSAGGYTAFSALGRAVWDETSLPSLGRLSRPYFQCSRSSRMG